MAKAPYMPLFVDAFVADTMHLSAEEIGAYMLLLMAMWRHGGELADDDKQLARVTKLTLAQWKRVRPKLPLLHFESEKVTQKRLKKEWEFMCEFRERQSRNARSKPLKINGQHQATTTNRHKPNTMPNVSPQDQDQDQSNESESFNQFWNLYPRKVGKDAARRAFTSAIKRAPLNDVLRGVARYAKARRGQEPRYTAHAATWLNGGRWADEEQAAVEAESFGGIRLREIEGAK